MKGRHLVKQNKNTKIAKTTKITCVEPKKKIDKTVWTRFNFALQKNTHPAKFSNEMIKKLSSLAFEYSFTIQQPNYQCKHQKTTPTLFDTFTFTDDIQTSLELIEQSEYFISDFVCKVEHYLQSLKKLFDSQSEKVITQSQRDLPASKSTNSRKDSDDIPCIHCTQLYEIGLKTLFTLKESCLAYSKICAYLLSCFVSRRLKSKKVSKKSPEQVKLCIIFIWNYNFFVHQKKT